MSRRPLRHLFVVAGLLMASAMLGCGAAPASLVDEVSTMRRPAPAARGPEWVPTPPPGQDARAFQLLSGIRALRDRHNAVSCDLELEVRRKSDGEMISSTCRFTHQKPGRQVLEVVTSEYREHVGTKVVWMGDDRVQVKTKFFGLWRRLELNLSDKRLVDAAGYAMEELSLDRMLDTLLHPQTEARWIGERSLNGMTVGFIEVVSPLRLDGVTREVYAISLESYIPVQREMFAGDALIHSATMRNVVLNPTLGRVFLLD